MKSIGGLILIFCTCLASAQTQQRKTQPFPYFPRRMMGLSQIRRPQRPAARELPALASPDIIPATCSPDAAGAVCGYVPVPLDRSQPGGEKINIYFELYPHYNPGPAESAILVNFGGPGGSTSDSRFFSQFLFGSNLDTHDLLLVDDRGRGLSAAIDCPELQHGTAPFSQAEADCAAQLGNAASRYGTGEVAKDTDDVRAALGYKLVDYFGASYGGMDVTAFATRFGKHLRSIVLDAPAGTPALNVLAKLQFRANSDPSMVQLDCLRSPTCAADHSNPVAEFNQLIQSIRLHPLIGDAHDAYGNLVHVHLDETALLNFVVTYPSGDFTSTGEILAAASALKRGDTVPLFRLAAEGSFTLIGDYGDPTGYSVAAFYSTACADAQEAFQWWQTPPQRLEAYEEAVDELPTNFFSPFAKDPTTGILFSTGGKQCMWWQIPTPSSPVTTAHPVYPNVPTLVLDGDLDNRVPLAETNKVAALFPNSIAVTIEEAGHETVGWTQCARDLVSEFVGNLQIADTSCANTPETVWPAVGRFPLRAADARPAEVDSTGDNQIGLAERKVATVAIATAIDAMQRSSMTFSDGVGLRGGSFHTDVVDTGLSITLTNCEFSRDITVNGTALWSLFTDASFVADLTVGGPGTAGGKLHVEGTWQAPGPVGQFKVSGTLGGKQVALVVPEA
jgi:pimeloyl-ACP methyl ester carboxylesterase